MTSTLRRTAMTVVCLFVLSLVVACGGGDGDDNDDAVPTNTTATGAASPTTAATPDDEDSEAGGNASPTTGATSPSGPASPTADTEASPTRDTSRPVATRAAEPTPTESDDDTGGDIDELTPEEQALAGLLLTADDLPAGWTVDSTGPADDEVDPDDQICGVESFPQREQKIAEVEGEYSVDSVDDPRLLLQNLVQFPEDVAVDAMGWAREASSCTEWVAEDGTTFDVIPLESPGLGDDSHAVRFSFDAGDGTIVEGDWVFIQVGDVIATIAYLAPQGADLASFYDIMVTATDKITNGASTGSTGPDIDPDIQAFLLDVLLTQEDVPQGWTLTSSGPGEEDDRETAFCNVPDFPLKDTRLGDAEAEFEVDPSRGPFVTQQITAFPDDVVGDAMDYVRETLSCSEWADDETGITFTVSPAYDPEVGEESVAVSFTLDIPGAGTGEGEAFFVRVGNVVMAVTAISLEPLGPGEVLFFAQTGTEKIEAALQ